MKICPLCKIEFNKDDRQICCSKSCSMKLKQKDGSWNKGIPHTEEEKKKISEGMFKSDKYNNLGKSSKRKEVRDKISKTLIEKGISKGSNNPNWKGGVTEKNRCIRNSHNLRSWSNKILNRDNYTCQMCFNKDYSLHAHHILSATKNEKLCEDINNGITLCKYCHYKTYGHEKKYVQLFKNIISGNKVITIISTRPCIIRQSLIIKKLDEYLGDNHIIIYTGQNYDPYLYNIFLKNLGIRKPNYVFNLDKKLSGNKFISDCMLNIEKVLTNYSPNKTILNILGDVNGSFASAYIAKRMGFKIFHNEAGNRSGRDILEEINRKNIDCMSYKLLCYTNISKQNLMREGYALKDIIVTGNPLIEVLKKYESKLTRIREDKYLLVTIHRHETITSLPRLESIAKALVKLSKEYIIVLSLHPSLKSQIDKYKHLQKLFYHTNIELHKPFNYTIFLSLMKYSVAILSDSGGECEEAAYFDRPCLVLRNETERDELAEYAHLCLCGTDTNNILDAFNVVTNISRRGLPPEYLYNVSNNVFLILTTNILRRWNNE